MKVWQAGTHLTDARGARVDDWTWARRAAGCGRSSSLPGRIGARTRSRS